MAPKKTITNKNWQSDNSKTIKSHHKVKNLTNEFSLYPVNILTPQCERGSKLLTDARNFSTWKGPNRKRIWMREKVQNKRKLKTKKPLIIN